MQSFNFNEFIAGRNLLLLEIYYTKFLQIQILYELAFKPAMFTSRMQNYEDFCLNAYPQLKHSI